MNTLDLDAWAERAAIMEFDGGLSRFKAETLAAEAQGATRWQMVEALNAQRKRNSARGGYQCSAVAGQQRQNGVPGVQPDQKEENRPMPQRDTEAGRAGVALLALRV